MLARTVAAFHPAGAVCGGALRPENVVLPPSVEEERYAATLHDLKDVVMFEGDNEAERRGKGDDMGNLGAVPLMTTQPPRTPATRRGLEARCVSGGTAGRARGRDCPCAWDRWSLRCWVFRGGEDAVGVDDNAAAADPNHATRITSPLRKGGGAGRVWGVG